MEKHAEYAGLWLLMPTGFRTPRPWTAGIITNLFEWKGIIRGTSRR